VQAWIIDQSKTIKVSSIQGRIAAIAHAHRLAGQSFDQRVMVGATLDGLKRQKGTAPKQARAIVLEDIRVAVSSLPNTIAGLRDKALLLLGFMAARRRSEIVGLDFGSLGEGATGFVQITAERPAHLSSSKQDGSRRRRSKNCRASKAR
jgi:hypothetical protein